MVFAIRYVPFAAVVLLTLAGSLGLLLMPVLLLALLGALSAVGVYDLVQQRHSLTHIYPLVGHLRRLAESVRPQIHQYFVESDIEGKPYDRNQRSLIYQRAKQQTSSHPFGTERDVLSNGYEWVNHSLVPKHVEHVESTVQIGNTLCSSPYRSSMLNISAMSFGSLSAAAIEALNRGAALGGFAHDTGEGAISPYHESGNGDLIWEIGTGYFGCRAADGGFDPDLFQAKAKLPQVKMIEIKLSQGAKPGHGGLLPGAKVTAEIAATRGIPIAEDCLSPAHHQTFDTPQGLLNFVAQLRTLSGGKPVGFKLCIGHRWEFMAICKAMLAVKIYPDFIVIDGNEGGTGAAPVEFTDHVGTPLRDGLLFARNALVGCGLKEHIRLGASGKIASGFDMAVCMALGADWCNAARGFMFALGCLQSQHCHTNHCPVGIATQDPMRQRGLDIGDKSERVANFHEATVKALVEITGAVGLSHPHELQPHHFFHRSSSRESILLSETYQLLAPGELLEGPRSSDWERIWGRASASSFSRISN